MIDRHFCLSCDSWTCWMSSASLLPLATCSCKNWILACLLVVVAIVGVVYELLLWLRSSDFALFVGGRKTAFL